MCLTYIKTLVKKKSCSIEDNTLYMSRRCIVKNALPNRSLVTNLSYEWFPVAIIRSKLKLFTNVTCKPSVKTNNRYLKSCLKKTAVSTSPKNIQFLAIEMKKVNNGLSLVHMKENLSQIIKTLLL